ncbi:FkbM family methyltransferase [Pontibacter sp. H259]|uniref:FkbM family methyltransferase n=1 Tax=Pontibacter sp. H259 TaxID=3133421 RepID=UPI0030BDDB71
MNFDRTDYLSRPVPIEKELLTLFSDNDPITIFEIGACEGEDSIRYSRMFPMSKIYAFEPLPKNISLIEGNFIKHEVKNVCFFNLALSSENGKAEFYVSQGRPEGVPETDWDYGNKSSSLLAPDKHKELAAFIEFNEKILVDTVTLESFCETHKINNIDFIHMDVQGAELMVLHGAGKFIYSIKSIWLEVANIHLYKNQPLADDIELFMLEHNFVLAKDCVEGIQGDQLYISKRYFPKYETVIKKFNSSGNTSFTSRVLMKLKRFISG